jgi:3D (Asp-Asp-Asp) domain-containing protein
MTETRRPNLIQRIARGMLVGLCGAMAVGMVGAVTVRAMDRSTSAPAVVVAEDMALATASTNGGELLVDDNSAPVKTNSVGLAIETVRPVVTLSSGKPKTRVIKMEVTGYCPCKKCCGPDARGVTASGKTVSYNKGRFVAADTKVLPFGTKLSIPGYHDGRAVEVIDRGGAIKGHKLDLYFPTHELAKQWGRKVVSVTVVE